MDAIRKSVRLCIRWRLVPTAITAEKIIENPEMAL